MKILFWNLQSADPLAGTSMGRSGHILASLSTCEWDAVIFCEVLDAALDRSDYEQLVKLAAADAAAPEGAKPTEALSLFEQRRVQAGADAIGFERGSRRIPFEARRRFEELRGDRRRMGQVTDAVSAISQSPGAMRRATDMAARVEHQRDLRLSRLSPLTRTYPYVLAYEAIQKDRNYLIYSRIDFQHDEVTVDVDSAKRNILRLTFGARTVYVVHAPSFGKGGGATAIQLTQLIAAHGGVALGDMNIDIEELEQTVEHETTNIPGGDRVFSRTRVRPVGPPAGAGSTDYSRRWFAARPKIRKSAPKTQRQGGTLDYAIAAMGSGVSVKIEVEPDMASYHAAIVVDIP